MNFLYRVLKWQFLLIPVALLSLFLLERSDWVGLISGCVLATLDLLVLTLTARKWLDSKREGSILKFGLVALLKFPVLAAAIWVLIIPLNMDAMGIAIGFSTMPLALILGIGTREKAG